MRLDKMPVEYRWVEEVGMGILVGGGVDKDGEAFGVCGEGR